MVAALDALGKRHMWQLAIKPGGPCRSARSAPTAVVLLGLPGNPVAVFVCFLLYVWPLLRRMGGAGGRSRGASSCRRCSPSPTARSAGASSGAACCSETPRASPSTSSPATAPA